MTLMAIQLMNHNFTDLIKNQIIRTYWFKILPRMEVHIRVSLKITAKINRKLMEHNNIITNPCYIGRLRILILMRKRTSMEIEKKVFRFVRKITSILFNFNT